MLGLGFYFGIGSVFTKQTERNYFPELQAGVIFPEALKVFVHNSRSRHFSGGAGVEIPNFRKMKDYDFRQIREWDDKTERSFILDPETDLNYFEAKAVDLDETEFKDGIRLNLIATNCMVSFFNSNVIELKGNRIVTVINRKNGNPISEPKLKKEMDKLSAVLDQYMLRKGMLREGDVATLKNWLRVCWPKEMYQYVEDKLTVISNFNVESSLIEMDSLEALVTDIVNYADIYLDECLEKRLQKNL